MVFVLEFDLNLLCCYVPVNWFSISLGCYATLTGFSWVVKTGCWQNGSDVQHQDMMSNIVVLHIYLWVEHICINVRLDHLTITQHYGMLSVLVLNLWETHIFNKSKDGCTAESNGELKDAYADDDGISVTFARCKLRFRWEIVWIVVLVNVMARDHEVTTARQDRIGWGYRETVVNQESVSECEVVRQQGVSPAARRADGVRSSWLLSCMRWPLDQP